MIRDVVRIDREKCNGCGACVEACAEGAIRMVDGKAMLVREDYCDGLGACLPECPTGAISIEKREAREFSDPKGEPSLAVPMACPGSGQRRIVRNDDVPSGGRAPSRLGQWPIQLRLINSAAPYLDGCELLVSGDCCAYGLGSFHEDFIKGRVCIIGCPKLDPQESWQKLKDIVSLHDIRSVTVTRMEVPCCSAMVKQVSDAVKASGKNIPVRTSVIHADGTVKNA